MVEDDRQGPDLAALWLVTAMGFTGQSDVVSLTPGWLGDLLRRHPFVYGSPVGRSRRSGPSYNTSAHALLRPSLRAAGFPGP